MVIDAKLSGGGGGGGVNIYNSDGVLTTNRAIDGNNKNLNIDGLKDFSVTNVTGSNILQLYQGGILPDTGQMQISDGAENLSGVYVTQAELRLEHTQLRSLESVLNRIGIVNDIVEIKAIHLGETNYRPLNLYFRDLIDGSSFDQILAYDSTTGQVGFTTGGGSSLFPIIGTGTATGNVIGDLNGNNFTLYNGNNLQIGATSGSLNITPSGIFLEDDSVVKKGLQYDNDYSDTLVNFSLTPKIYVDNVIPKKQNFVYITQPITGSALTSDWTAVGSPTYTVTNGEFFFTGFPNSYAKYIRSNLGVLMESSKLECFISPNVITAGDFGIEIGWKSYNLNGYTHSMRGGWVSNAGDANYGKAILSGETGTYTSYGSTAQTSVSAGDIIKLTLIQRGLSYTIIVENQTKGWSVSNTQLATPSGTPFVSHNSAYPAIFHKGGAWEVYGFKYTVQSPLDLNMIIVGDSITEGQSASTENVRWAARIGDPSLNIISGGGADTTQEVVTRLPEIVALKPKKVALMIGGNDILFGVSSGTWQANYATIRNTIAAAGIEVVHFLPTPRTTVDVSPLKTYIQANFQNDLIIDTYTPLLGSGTTLLPAYDNGDGTHPNNAGADQLVATINDGLHYWGGSIFSIPKNLLAHNGYISGTDKGTGGDQAKAGGLLAYSLNSSVKYTQIGYTSGYGWISALTEGTSYDPIVINPGIEQGVGISETTIRERLSIRTSGSGSQELLGLNHGGAFSANGEEIRLNFRNSGTLCSRIASYVHDNDKFGVRIFGFQSSALNSTATLEIRGDLVTKFNGAARLVSMTKVARNLLTPTAGDAIYQNDNTPGLRVYNGTNWMRYTETID